MIPKEQLEEAKRAKAELVKGNLTIWNVRLETMVTLGDRGVLDQLVRPIEGFDVNVGCNPGCNNGCPAPGGGGSGSW